MVESIGMRPVEVKFEVVGSDGKPPSKPPETKETRSAGDDSVQIGSRDNSDKTEESKKTKDKDSKPSSVAKKDGERKAEEDFQAGYDSKLAELKQGGSPTGLGGDPMASLGGAGGGGDPLAQLLQALLGGTMGGLDGASSSAPQQSSFAAVG